MTSPLGTTPRLDTGTGKQQRIDAACQYQAAVDKKSSDDIKKMLDMENLMGTGCKVIKHPDCCAPCAANHDCEKLPIHVGCRCRRDDYLTIDTTMY